MAKLIRYSGTVQGVGFRATAAMIARHHDVRGWVKNLPDGGVELIVDGSSSAMEAFLTAVRTRMADYIDSESCEERDLDHPVEGFRIVH
jgi:acylphosphatase